MTAACACARAPARGAHAQTHTHACTTWRIIVHSHTLTDPNLIYVLPLRATLTRNLILIYVIFFDFRVMHLRLGRAEFLLG